MSTIEIKNLTKRYGEAEVLSKGNAGNDFYKRKSSRRK